MPVENDQPGESHGSPGSSLQPTVRRRNRFRLQFSLLTLIAIAVVVSIFLALTTGEKLAELDRLKLDGENDVRVFEVVNPRFNVHTENGTKFLTVYLDTGPQIEPETKSRDDHHLEFSVPFTGPLDSLLHTGAEITVASYHKQHFNMSYFYNSGFDGFDGVFTVHSRSDSVIDATLVADYGFVVRAKFKRDPKLLRSFD